MIRGFNVLPRQLNELIRGRGAPSIGKPPQRVDRVQVGPVIRRAEIFVEGARNFDSFQYIAGFPRRELSGAGILEETLALRRHRSGEQGDVRVGRRYVSPKCGLNAP